MERQERLGDLVLTGLLGEGAVGRVWRGVARDGTQVAVKVARPEAARDPRIVRLLRAEVRAMARLDHPNVAWVYDQGTVPLDHPTLPGGSPYVVLEHCSGGTLADHPPADWPALARTLAVLLGALAHAHAHELVHRDLKPANVLWSGPTDLRPGPKLADFGVAHAIGVAGGPRIAGTLRYMPPEQRDGALDRQGPWTDLFALGVVAFELAHGTAPSFDASGVPRWSTTRFPVADGWLSFVARLTAPEPEDRFRSAAAAWKALEALAPGVVEAPPSGWRGAGRHGPPLRVQGAGLGLVALREHEVVGRVAERRCLWEALEGAVAGGEPRTVVVRGPRGLGKSRLLTWIATRAREDGRAITSVVSAADPDPLGALLTRILRLQDLPVPRRAAAAVAKLRRLGLSAPDAAQLEELLDNGLGTWGRVPAVREALALVARSEPLVLCFDDLEADDGPVELARALWVDRDDRPVVALIVLATDRVGVADLQSDDGATTLKLGPLSPSESDRLVGALVGLEPTVAGVLAERGGGNPGFVVGAVQRWIADGALVPDGRHFRPTGTLAWPEAALDPRWLEGLLADAPDHARVALELAAAQGLHVDEELWDETCAGGGQVTEAGLDPRAVRWRMRLVQALLDAGRVVETDRGFSFTEPALVEAISAGARAAGREVGHHRLLAERWEARGRSLRAGRHFALAGEDARALDLVLQGGREAFQTSPRELGAAVALARELLARLAVPELDPRTAATAYHASGVDLLAGSMSTSVDHAQRALELARATGADELAALARVRVADVLVLASRWEDAQPTLEALVSEATPPRTRARAMGRLGFVMASQGRASEAERWFAEGERLLRDLPHDPEALTTLVEVLQLRGGPGATTAIEDTCLEALPALHAAGRLQDERFLLARLFSCQVARGDLAAVRDTGRRMQKVAAQVGSRRASVLALAQLAAAEARLGDPVRATENAATALRSVEQLDDARLTQAVLGVLATCAASARDAERFDAALTRLLSGPPLRARDGLFAPGSADADTVAWAEQRVAAAGGGIATFQS